MCKFLFVILLLSALFFSCSFPGSAQDYLMSETERTEALNLISNLEQTLQRQKELLNKLGETNADLSQRLTDTEKKLSDLKASLEANQIILSDLRQQLELLKKDLADSEKLLKAYERRIRWLEIERWLWAAAGVLVGHYLL